MQGPDGALAPPAKDRQVAVMKRAKKTIKLVDGTEIELKGGDGEELKSHPSAFTYSEADPWAMDCRIRANKILNWED